MHDLNDLELLLSSSSPIVFVESREQLRPIQLIVRVGLRRHRAVFRRSVTEGLARAETASKPMLNTQTPEGVLRHIETTPLQGLYVSKTDRGAVLRLADNLGGVTLPPDSSSGHRAASGAAGILK